MGEERAKFIRGLRDLADFLDERPESEAPTPDFASIAAFFRSYKQRTPDQFVAAAVAVGGVVAVNRLDVRCTRAFGPIEYQLIADASDVCVEREVVQRQFVLPEELEAMAETPAAEAVSA